MTAFSAVRLEIASSGTFFFSNPYVPKEQASSSEITGTRP